MSAPRCAWCGGGDEVLPVADGEDGHVYACTRHREQLGLEPLPPAPRILEERP